MNGDWASIGGAWRRAGRVARRGDELDIRDDRTHFMLVISSVGEVDVVCGTRCRIAHDSSFPGSCASNAPQRRFDDPSTRTAGSPVVARNVLAHAYAATASLSRPFARRDASLTPSRPCAATASCTAEPDLRATRKRGSSRPT